MIRQPSIHVIPWPYDLSVPGGTAGYFFLATDTGSREWRRVKRIVVGDFQLFRCFIEEFRVRSGDRPASVVLFDPIGDAPGLVVILILVVRKRGMSRAAVLLLNAAVANLANSTGRRLPRQP